MRRPFALTACLGVLAALPAPAAAVEPGVHVDPGSPAGKEYALPLDQARREAGGSGIGGSNDPSSSGSGKGGGSQLFGEGIKKKPGGGSGGSARDKDKAATAARLGVSPGGSSTLTDVGIALAVLMTAGALGFGLRRVLR
jgi:hypothetical protein